MSRWTIALIITAFVIVPQPRKSICTASISYAALPGEFAGTTSVANVCAAPHTWPKLKARVQEVLRRLHPHVPYSEDAVRLLLMTAAHETKLGKRLVQVRGPAMGMFQMERKTEIDTLERLWSKHPNVHHAVMSVIGWSWHPRLLMEDIDYQIAIARAYYWLRTRKVPSCPEMQAMTAKRHWNTKAGKAKVRDYLLAYHSHKE